MHPLTEEEAWAVIVTHSDHRTVKPDNAALIRALGIPAGAHQGRLRCPSHEAPESRHKSLSWRITDDGGLLIHCFYGCTFEEIRKAVGE